MFLRKVLVLLFLGIIFVGCSRDKNPLKPESKSNTETIVETGSMTDIDGNVYKTVKIGDQWWMAENLKVTHYRNGDAIPNVIDNREWKELTTGAYCYYDNNINIKDEYGRTPLHFAARYENEEIAEILIEAGADVNIKDKDGQTPLYYAESKEVKALLKSYGAIL